MTLTEIRQALETRGLRPLKQLGQNFLHDQNLARWLADHATADLFAGATVVEIGPGLGALTSCLLEKDLRLVALEKDRGLCAFLREKFSGEMQQGRFDLREGDALELLPALEIEPAAICGNLPYYISTPLLMTCLELRAVPSRLFFLMQKEVGQRLVSPPGHKAYGSLSVLIQAACVVTLVRTLPASVFYPAPEIESVAVQLVPRPDPLVPRDAWNSFAETVYRGFSQRRKKLSNLLPVADSRRAEELSPEQWVELWQKLR